MKPQAYQERIHLFAQTHRTGLVTMVFTDLVGSVQLKQDLGDRAAVALIQAHHATVRDLLTQFAEAEEISTAGDSFFLVFTRPSEAVRFALLLQAELRTMSSGMKKPIQDRIGIHVGEVIVEEQSRAGRDLYGIQVDTCARVMSLAEGDQILLTRSAFDNARQVLKGEELARIGELRWLSHGWFSLKGVDEPLEVCEVGEVDKAGLKPPPDSEKVKRHGGLEGEPVLGWRPASGQKVPGTEWALISKLGEGGFGEVWLGRHGVLREERVFKFCFRADRVRALKREVTIWKVLKEKLGEHPNIVPVREVYFEAPPFYIVMDYAAGEDLRLWCERQGGADRIPLGQRMEVLAQLAEALGAAHQAGILHRDVKPGNILISEAGGRIRVRLSDFGIGNLMAKEGLDRAAVAGFTQTMMGDSAPAGSSLYLAPELLAGGEASPASDFYALGVVAFQLLLGNLSEPLTQDWKQRLLNPLFQELVGRMTAGNPAKRLIDGGRLATLCRALQAKEQYRLTRLRRSRTRDEITFSLLRGAGILVALAGLAGLYARGIPLLIPQGLFDYLSWLGVMISGGLIYWAGQKEYRGGWLSFFGVAAIFTGMALIYPAAEQNWQRLVPFRSWAEPLLLPGVILGFGGALCVFLGHIGHKARAERAEIRFAELKLSKAACSDASSSYLPLLAPCLCAIAILVPWLFMFSGNVLPGNESTVAVVGLLLGLLVKIFSSILSVWRGGFFHLEARTQFFVIKYAFFGFSLMLIFPGLAADYVFGFSEFVVKGSAAAWLMLALGIIHWRRFPASSQIPVIGSQEESAHNLAGPIGFEYAEFFRQGALLILVAPWLWHPVGGLITCLLIWMLYTGYRGGIAFIFGSSMVIGSLWNLSLNLSLFPSQVLDVLMLHGVLMTGSGVMLIYAGYCLHQHQIHNPDGRVVSKEDKDSLLASHLVESIRSAWRAVVDQQNHLLTEENPFVPKTFYSWFRYGLGIAFLIFSMFAGLSLCLGLGTANSEFLDIFWFFWGVPLLALYWVCHTWSYTVSTEKTTASVNLWQRLKVFIKTGPFPSGSIIDRYASLVFIFIILCISVLIYISGNGFLGGLVCASAFSLLGWAAVSWIGADSVFVLLMLLGGSVGIYGLWRTAIQVGSWQQFRFPDMVMLLVYLGASIFLLVLGKRHLPKGDFSRTLFYRSMFSFQRPNLPVVRRCLKGLGWLVGLAVAIVLVDWMENQHGDQDWIQTRSSLSQTNILLPDSSNTNQQPSLRQFSNSDAATVFLASYFDAATTDSMVKLLICQTNRQSVSLVDLNNSSIVQNGIGSAQSELAEKIEFRGVELNVVLGALARMAGIKLILHQDLETTPDGKPSNGPPITLELTNVYPHQALSQLMNMYQLGLAPFSRAGTNYYCVMRLNNLWVARDGTNYSLLAECFLPRTYAQCANPPIEYRQGRWVSYLKAPEIMTLYRGQSNALHKVHQAATHLESILQRSTDARLSLSLALFTDQNQSLARRLDQAIDVLNIHALACLETGQENEALVDLKALFAVIEYLMRSSGLESKILLGSVLERCLDTMRGSALMQKTNTTNLVARLRGINLGDEIQSGFRQEMIRHQNLLAECQQAVCVNHLMGLADIPPDLCSLEEKLHFGFEALLAQAAPRGWFMGNKACNLRNRARLQQIIAEADSSNLPTTNTQGQPMVDKTLKRLYRELELPSGWNLNPHSRLARKSMQSVLSRFQAAGGNFDNLLRIHNELEAMRTSYKASK